MTDTKRTVLTSLFRSGVMAVRGDMAVKRWLSKAELEAPNKILAVGKAAVSMFEGVADDWQGSLPALIVTKSGHIASSKLKSNVMAYEASHPVPDKSSLLAGAEVFEFINQCKPGDRLLILLSGGASALVEHLQDGVSYDDLVELNQEALSDGANIAQINKRRKAVSAIKGGKLLANFKGSCVDVLAISDVCGDDIGIIGSGIGAAPVCCNFEYRSHIVASNCVARHAIIEAAFEMGLKVVANAETMYDDVQKVAQRIAEDLQNGPNGLYLYGGEPTVVLPKKPGKGGRNQALALELAKLISKRPGIAGLVAGTDGKDGPTQAAGGYLDGNTFEASSGGDEALINADSASFLKRVGDQVITGPTGTNVMDIAILIKDV